LTMVLGTGFLLLISMALSTFLSSGMSAVGAHLPMSEGIAHALNFIVSFGVISLLFAMIFKYLPDVKVPFRVVWFGAILTAFLFTIGKYALALYLGRESTASPYGAAGSVIIIMMWVYYASVILLFGAEFTHAYARVTGTEVVPNKFAVPVTREQRAQQGLESVKKDGRKGASEGRKPEPGRKQEGGDHDLAGKPAIAAAMVAKHEKRLRENETVAADWLAKQNPQEYVTVLLAAGVIGGLLLRVRLLRRGVRGFLESR